MAEKRIQNPDKSSSADVSRVSRSHDQDGHYTHIWENSQLLCPVTVLVDSQVSDRCPWATCLYHDLFITLWLEYKGTSRQQSGKRRNQ